MRQRKGSKANFITTDEHFWYRAKERPFYRNDIRSLQQIYETQKFNVIDENLRGGFRRHNLGVCKSSIATKKRSLFLSTKVEINMKGKRKFSVNFHASKSIIVKKLNSFCLPFGHFCPAPCY